MSITSIEGLYTDDMLVRNEFVDRREIPMIWGSGPSLYANNSGTESIIEIPSYGFMTGAREVLCLEFWVTYGGLGKEEFNNTLLESSSELIRFSNHSSLRIYRNQLILTYFNEYLAVPFDRFGFPVLVNINYARKPDGIHVSILVDGKSIGSKKFKYVLQDVESKFIKFVNESSYKIVYGPIVMYPYNITSNMATKHFVYGQGTAQPLSYKTIAGSGVTELGGKFTKRGSQTVLIPASLSWNSGIIENLSTSTNIIGFVPRLAPTPIVNRDGQERYYFDKLQDYYSSPKYGIGMRAYVESNAPDLKYVLAVIRLGQDFIVMYVKDTKISVDYKIGDDQKFEIYTMPITTEPINGVFNIDVTLIFEELYKITGTVGQQLVDNAITKVTIGYIDEDLNATVRGNGISVAEDYYVNLPGPDQLVYIVRFLTRTSVVDDPQILVENTCVNCAVNWYELEKGIYQIGHWATEFPISLLSEQIAHTNEGGYEYLQEQLDYIQYNIDNYADTVSHIMIKDSSIDTPASVINDNLIFTDLDSLLNNYVEIKNNEILKLPYIPQEKYPDLLVRILITINSNFNNAIATEMNIKEIRFTGESVPRSKPLIIGNVTENNVATFERTDDMMFPKWNTDVQLKIPTMDMPFYYLNERLAYYLVDDGKYNDGEWDRGFLLTKYFSDDGTDLVYGFSTFMYVEPNTPQTSKLLRLNFVDYMLPNQLGNLEIEWTDTDPQQFMIISNPSTDNAIDIYIDYEKLAEGTALDTDKWYVLTAIYKPGKIVWDSSQTKALYMEFLSPKIYFTNPNILSVHNTSENKFIVDYYIGSDQIVRYLTATLAGSFSEILVTTDGNSLIPIITNAWMSAYINVTWDSISVEERT